MEVHLTVAVVMMKTQNGRGIQMQGRTSGGNPSTQNLMDVSHLISTLAARLRVDTPRISIFSGEATPGKTSILQALAA